MNVEFLIIGQGISGTWLSYFLHQENRSFLVIDDADPNASSRLSAGVINPVTGRRHVEVWMAEEILPFAWKAYHELGRFLDIHPISLKSLIDFFPNPQMRESFIQRVAEKKDYVFDFDQADLFHDYFRFEFGAGEIKPVYVAHLETILPSWRKYLLEKELLIEGAFDLSQLKTNGNKIQLKEIEAGSLIFCNGHVASSNPWFKNLPFAHNKGEILVADIPELNSDYIYKKGLVIVPLAEKDLWWVGSDYKWEFEDVEPTKQFRERTESFLKKFLKIPFKIIDHRAGIRPATLERRPFVGMHPVQKNIGILNGMGTKGCSLAPYFAKQLCDHLLHHLPIAAEADVNRFQKILSK